MEGYGFDTQKEIKSVLKWKENANFICWEKCINYIIFLAQALQKKNHLNVKGAFTLYAVGKDRMD